MSVFTFRVDRGQPPGEEAAAQFPPLQVRDMFGSQPYTQSAPSFVHVVPSRGRPAGQSGAEGGASHRHVMGPLHCCTGYFVQFVHSQSVPA